jgi:hypothetical protein
LEALASSQNWRRPETQLSDTACTHGANCSRVLPAGGCSPAVAVNGRSLAGDGGNGRSPAGEGGSGSAQVQRGSAPPATLQHPGGMHRAWGGFDCRACGKAFLSCRALRRHLGEYPSHKAAPGWVAPAAPEVRSTSSIVDPAVVRTTTRQSCTGRICKISWYRAAASCGTIRESVWPTWTASETLRLK